MKKLITRLLAIAAIGLTVACAPQDPSPGPQPSIECEHNQDVWIEVDGTTVSVYPPPTFDEYPPGDFFVAWDANPSWVPSNPDAPGAMSTVASDPINRLLLTREYAPGVYRIAVWFVVGSSGADVARCTVTVTGSGYTDNTPRPPS